MKKKGKKLSREERIEIRYGDVTLKRIADENDICNEYYKLYISSKKTVRRDEIAASVCYFISLSFVILSFFYPPILVSGAVFLVVATHSALNARIERLWVMRWMDRIFETYTREKIREEVEDMEEKK